MEMNEQQMAFMAVDLNIARTQSARLTSELSEKNKECTEMKTELVRLKALLTADGIEDSRH